MADETIHFFPAPPDSGLLAVAEVTLFPGVSLRGWHILEQGEQIVVLPPHQVYEHPDTGEDAVFELLHFQKDQTRTVWLGRVREEFVNWRKRSTQDA